MPATAYKRYSRDVDPSQEMGPGELDNAALIKEHLQAHSEAYERNLNKAWKDLPEPGEKGHVEAIQKAIKDASDKTSKEMRDRAQQMYGEKPTEGTSAENR